MGPVPIAVPEAFAAWTIAREGDAGRAWIEALPDLVASYLDRWALTPDGPMLHGYVGIAQPVLRASAERAVLKVSWLDAGGSWEAAALSAWEGRGAVLLLERDDAAGVMLLERLDPARSARELDRGAAAALAGTLCRRLEAPAPPGMPRLADVAARWADELPRTWERLNRPFERRLLEAALAACEELGPGQPDRLLHGNLRLDHILRGEREPWLVIDPNGLAGEPAYEVAHCSAASAPACAATRTLAGSCGADWPRLRTAPAWTSSAPAAGRSRTTCGRLCGAASTNRTSCRSWTRSSNCSMCRPRLLSSGGSTTSCRGRCGRR